MAKLPEQPKGMKDPVLIAGEWKERVAPPVTAGKTRVDIKDADAEQAEDLKDKEFLKRADYLKGIGKTK